LADKTVRVRLEALVAQYQAGMAAATASTTKFSAAQIAARTQYNATNKVFTTMGIAGLVVGGALAFGLKRAADAAIEFESSFAGVRKTVDGSEAELQAISDGIREMATEIPVGVNELNRIAESAGQLGIAKEGILAFTRTVADLSVTTNLTADEASDALARIANIMGTAEEDFDRLGSTIVELGNKSAATETEIVEFGLRIAGAGALADFAEADILAFAAHFSSIGIAAEAGGTAVQKGILGIESAIATGGQQLEIFAQTAGMSAEAFATAWGTDPAIAFAQFIEGLGRAGPQGILILQKLFGVNERVARAFLSSAAASGDLTASLVTGRGAWEDNNALAEEAAKRYDTTAAKIQVAKNEINDAAISFGSVLLPAIAAVMGTLGDFAGIIGDLPEPLKTIAVVLTAAAAALFLLGGAALLALPRIALLRTEIAKAGINAGVLRGSLKLAAGAINPLTIGISAAVVGLGFFISAHQEAQQRVDDFTEAIKADSGALGENTRIAAVNALTKADLFQVAQQFGIAQATLTDAALGEADALAEVAAAIALYRDAQDGATIAGKAGEVALSGTESSARHLERALGILNGEMTEAQIRALDEAAAMEGSADANKDGTISAEEHAAAEAGLSVELEKAASAAETLQLALDELAGDQLDARAAASAYEQSLDDLRVELRRGAKTLDLNTQAGRDNDAAIRRNIDDAIAHGVAVAQQSGSVQKGSRIIIEHVEALKDQMRQAGFTRREIKNYIDMLNLTPAEIRTQVRLETQAARNDLLSYREQLNALNGFTATTYVDFVRRHDPGVPTTPHGVEHTGGIIGQSGPTRLHGGGLVPLGPNEVSIIAERGEGMIPEPLMRTLRAAGPLPGTAGTTAGELMTLARAINSNTAAVARHTHPIELDGYRVDRQSARARFQGVRR
jgi:TP901 family phage tail tape measure protein